METDDYRDASGRRFAVIATPGLKAPAYIRNGGRPFRAGTHPSYSTSRQRGAVANAARINPTCEYACGKFPVMSRPPMS